MKKTATKNNKLTPAQKKEAKKVLKLLVDTEKATAEIKAKIAALDKREQLAAAARAKTIALKEANEIELKEARKQQRAEAKAEQRAREEILNDSTRYSAGIARGIGTILASYQTINHHKENLYEMFSVYMQHGQGDAGVRNDITDTFTSLLYFFDGLQTGYVEAEPVKIKRA